MPGGNVLIVDDDVRMLNLLNRMITLENYTVFEAADLSSAGKIVEKGNIEVIVCDVKLPDGDGIEFTKQIKASLSNLEIILLTAHGTIKDCVQAMKYGAFDYIIKGVDNEKLLPLIENALEKSRLHQRVQQLEKQAIQKFGFETIVGDSSVIQDVISLAKKVAPTNTTVLLLGETGTGKELFAKAIHTTSKRAHKPFLALNCSSFSRDLLESELFGYKAGAFTGAVRDKKGLIEEANGGTLFLDEIGEMNIELQAKLLRVLENSEFIKLGSTTLMKSDVRIISATNKDLESDVLMGKFRQDLFYRLNVFSLQIPPLRDRKKDIYLLARYYMNLFAEKMNKEINGLSKELLFYLENEHWKGNIRELKNTIERAVIITEHTWLSVEDLPLEMQLSRPELKLVSSFALENVEKVHIQKVLNYTKGNKIEAAKLLNIGLTTIYRKMEGYGLSVE